jgi:hypothetical protein
MKRRISLDQLIVVGGIIAILLMWALANTKRYAVGSKFPLTGSSSPAGVSVFFELKESLQKSSSVSLRRPILKETDLANFQTLFILSPAIRAFVGEAPNFTDSVATNAVSKDKHGLFAQNESYSFYSRLRFQDDICFQNSADCYVRSGKSGSGDVTVFAGLPPFANGLIGREQNTALASRLALSSGRIAFDDYHLLATEKTLGDFLTDPGIVGPVLGLLIGIFLYFFFGGGEFEEEVARASTGQKVRSLHSLNREILRAVVGEKRSMQEACVKHAQFLERLMPRDREQIQKLLKGLVSSELSGITTAKRLVRFHQNWLKSRGRD